MGLMDKMKKILFDEEEVEEVEKKEKVTERRSPVETRSGFVDHSSVTEDTITEIKLPKEEVARPTNVAPTPAPKEEKAFGFTLDLDNYDAVPEVRTKDAVQSQIRDSYYKSIERPSRNDYSSSMHNKYSIDKKPENKYQTKDYKKIISNPSIKERKPFTVTPVISPVYGIIDEEYIKANGAKIMEERKEEKKEEIFGPVSYIEDILPKKMKEENTGLTTDEIEVKEVVEEIVTPNYDDYSEIKTSGIENDYIGNNVIEDAFEPTSEYESFNYEPENVITESEKEENKALADTIETDLFNLIDSMYRDEEDE